MNSIWIGYNRLHGDRLDIFIAPNINAAGFIANAIFVLVKPEAVSYLWQEPDLMALLSYDQRYFFVQVSIISIASALKAILFIL